MRLLSNISIRILFHCQGVWNVTSYNKFVKINKTLQWHWKSMQYLTSDKDLFSSEEPELSWCLETCVQSRMVSFYPKRFFVQQLVPVRIVWPPFGLLPSQTFGKKARLCFRLCCRQTGCLKLSKSRAYVGSVHKIEDDFSLDFLCLTWHAPLFFHWWFDQFSRCSLHHNQDIRSCRSHNRKRNRAIFSKVCDGINPKGGQSLRQRL